MAERTVRPGEFYRHFKNKLYQIVAVAEHSETREMMVVYQALYGDFRTYVRPYDMFVGEVDHEKYPDVQQKYRFQKVEMKAQGAEQQGGETGQEAQGASQQVAAHCGAAEQHSNATSDTVQIVDVTSDEEVSDEIDTEVTTDPNPDFLQFLDTEDYNIRMECLKRLESVITDKELDSIYVVLDMKPEEGDVKARVEAIRHFLSTRNHFDGNRLR